MRTSLRNGVIAVGVIALAAGCAVGALLVIGANDDEHESAPVREQAQLRSETVGDAIREPTQSPPISAGGTDRPSGRALDLADLHASCPSFRDVINAECLAILDAYFQDRPVSSGILAVVDTPVWHDLAVVDTPVWHDVFDDPDSAIDGTARTLAEATCDVANGKIRQDPGGDCDARSLVELAVLRRECSRGHEWTVRYAAFEQRLSRIEHIADNTIYWQRRNAIEEDVFRSAWLGEKCATVPEDALIPLYHFEISVDDINMSHPPDSFYPDRPLAGDEVDGYMRVETERLIEMAARLGDAWALSEFRGDAAHVDRLFEVNPTQAYIHEAELGIEKVRQRYQREHFEGLDRQRAERLQEVDQRYPRVVSLRDWGRARAAAIIRGDSAERRRLESQDPIAGLNDDELEELRKEDDEHWEEESAVFDEFDRMRSEIGARLERDERLVRLIYAMLVEAEAKSAGMAVDVIALYERAAPFSEEDIEVARQRASAIALLRSQTASEDQ